MAITENQNIRRADSTNCQSSNMLLVVLSLITTVKAFTAFDCNNVTAPVETFSLLAPEDCATGEKDKEIERVIFGEIIQMKQERYIQVCCYQAVHVPVSKVVNLLFLETAFTPPPSSIHNVVLYHVPE